MSTPATIKAAAKGTFASSAPAVIAATVSATAARDDNTARQADAALAYVRSTGSAATICDPARSTVPTTVKSTRPALRLAAYKDSQRLTRGNGDCRSYQTAAGGLTTGARRSYGDVRYG
ncbi:MAG TPA: hypothetical protein VGF86_05630 [Candidatus Tumulicola sp.]